MPVWEAQYVIVLANRCGWSEDFIRWQLPLARGFPYYHAARILDGENCRWPIRAGGSHDPASIRSRIRQAVLNFTTGNQ